MTDSIRALWQATQAFYERFGMMPPKFDAALAYTVEEYREFRHAAQFADDVRKEIVKDGNWFDARELTVHEAADLIVTALGVLMALDLDVSDLQAAMADVAEKNAKKTNESHVVVDGMITRKDKIKEQGE